MLANPFSFFIAAFSGVGVLYLIPWSDYYPDMSLPVIVFFVFAFIVSFALFYITKSFGLKNGIGRIDYPSIKLHLFLFCLLGVINLLYIGHVPIFASSLGEGYNSKEINTFPMLYPMYISYAYFFGCYFFFVWLRVFQLKYLAASILFLVPHFVLLQRGIVFSQLFTCALIYMVFKSKVTIAIRVYFVIALLLATVLFGYLGGLRDSGREYYRPITDIGGATESYYNSPFGYGQFYVWLYLTSPMANFQRNVNSGDDEIYANYFDLIVSELIPDSIAKRFVDYEYLQYKYADYRIVETLNVGTMFTRSFSIAGWPGVYFYFAFYSLFIFLYLLGLRILSVKKSPFVIVGLAMACNFVLLSTFDNMLSNSARVFPLYIPFLLELFNYKPNENKK